MDPLSDELLIARSRSGDREAFGKLVLRHRDRILRLAYGMTDSHSVAEDLCQEAFMRAYLSLKKFRNQSSFSTWIHRIAMNLTLTHLKRQRKRKLAMAAAVESRTASTNTGPDSEREELRAAVGEALLSLSPKHRAAVVLTVLQGLSHKEAAKIMGRPEGTISWWLWEARKKLAARLRPFLA